MKANVSTDNFKPRINTKQKNPKTRKEFLIEIERYAMCYHKIILKLTAKGET